MIAQIKYSFFTIAFLVMTLMTSCSDQGFMNASLVDTISAKEIMENSVNRARKEVIIETKENEQLVSFSVIYTGDLDLILLDESSTLYQAVNIHDLNLQDPFEIDEEMKGIILHSYATIEKPVELAKFISNGENILMVEVQNIAKSDV